MYASNARKQALQTAHENEDVQRVMGIITLEAGKGKVSYPFLKRECDQELIGAISTFKFYFEDRGFQVDENEGGVCLYA